METSFAKYAGCGNDFIFFNNLQGSFSSYSRSLITTLCHRQQGIGADGVIFVESSCKADFRMRIFNADGSEAEMCGNGIRCFKKFLGEIGFNKPSYKIETMQRILSVISQGDDVCVEMGNPTDLRWNLPVSYQDETYAVHSLNTGVPHVVLFVEDLNRVDLLKIGPFLRRHALFAPSGTNVNIARMISSKELALRTYERGVEGETLACGTGVTAVALAAAYQYGLSSPLRIITRSTESLIVDFQRAQNGFSDVKLTGPAQRVFQGSVKLSALGAEETVSC